MWASPVDSHIDTAEHHDALVCERTWRVCRDGICGELAHVSNFYDVGARVELVYLRGLL